MSVRVRVCALLLGINFCAAVVSIPANAQGKQQHVVSQEELSNDSAKPGDTRHADEAAVRHLLSSEAGQQALKSANVDYQRVDKAISQLSDRDLAKLADRSRQVENDFAAGFISPKHLAYIILATVVIVVIIVLAT